MAEVAKDSLAKNFFEQSYQITDAMGKPLTNVYWSHANRHTPVTGSLYLIHGYGGSPVEPLFKVPMTYALSNGFDVVAIEGVGMSATCGEDKVITDLTLERQKMALANGLEFCHSELHDINNKYNVGWLHSMSCRALSDLVVDSDFIRRYFKEVVLSNPYFMAPPKLIKAQQKFYRIDPTGNSWDAMAKRNTNLNRNIEGRTYVVPTCIYNLAIPLPANWAIQDLNFSKVAYRMSHFVRHLYTRFILGTADNMADYNQNVEFFDGLRVPRKQIIKIDGGNHLLENVLEEYNHQTKSILNSILENARRYSK